MELAAPEIAEVVSGRKSFERAAQNIGRQTLKRQLSGGGKQRTLILTKSTKQTSRSLRENSTNIPR